ncbi:UPF0193 protein EVG1 homolog [Pseudomyrmex gracilis]|uniref:UPF0193 protein EVG1 homolog n=1 Tax=Pseudomyrmex gracilis TaxID=219809 RepID=UPI000995A76C|nr:UPF0193 protein EVG1 homolog [Pseudomyrmex gracilis]XP_020292055.1 UPF0193 protein EVG1 homolog [Pseudomyrmex gracilis]
MDRKYQRVGLGVGAFHNPPIAKYSEETRNLIKLLMEESKLTMLQRKTIQNAVDNGEPLPLSVERTRKKDDKIEDNGHLLKSNSAWRRRSQETIISSGAYEREQYRRTTPLLDKDKQKRHLACMMAYGKDMPATPHGPKILHRPRREPQPIETADLLNDLVQGIRERMDFLRDMESLGMGKKYRTIIQQEIAQKIRLIESLDKSTSDELRNEICEFRFGDRKKPSPRPFLPLGELEEN